MLCLAQLNREREVEDALCNPRVVSSDLSAPRLLWCLYTWNKNVDLHPCITLAFFLSGDLEASDSRRYSKCQTASNSQTFPKPPQAPFETSINWQTSEMLIRNQYYLFIEFAPPPSLPSIMLVNKWHPLSSLGFLVHFNFMMEILYSCLQCFTVKVGFSL